MSLPTNTEEDPCTDGIGTGDDGIDTGDDGSENLGEEVGGLNCGSKSWINCSSSDTSISSIDDSDSDHIGSSILSAITKYLVLRIDIDFVFSERKEIDNHEIFLFGFMIFNYIFIGYFSYWDSTQTQHCTKNVPLL